MGKKYDEVDPRKANESVIDEELARLELPGGGSIAKKIRRIREYVDENSSEEDVLACDTCGGVSCDALFDRCPYCGDSETDLDPREEDVETVETEGTLTADDVVVSDGAVVSVSTLEECAAGIRRLQSDMWGNYYEIGLFLKKVHDADLWKLRTEDGRPVYKNFLQWAKAEVNLERTQAYKCLGVANHCTREQVEQFGHSKLGVCFAPKLPPEVQEKLIEEMREGASRHQLMKRSAELRALSAGAGDEPSSAGETEDEDEQENAPREPAPSTTTVALTLTQQALPMFARKATSDGEVVRARSVSEDAWAEMRLQNDVVMRFRLAVEPTGELALLVACERLNVSGI